MIITKTFENTEVLMSRSPIKKDVTIHSRDTNATERNNPRLLQII